MSLDRAQAPPFTLSSNYSLAQPEKFTLAGGQPLYAFRALQQDVVKLDLCFEAGKWYEPASGISHFTTQLIRKGTRTRTSFEIAEALDRLGAHLDCLAGFDSVTISLLVLRKNLFPALEILRDILLEASFPEEELRLEKEIFIQNLLVNNEKTSVLASREIRKVLFGTQHPYGNATEEKDAEQVAASQLQAFFRSSFHISTAYFIGPANDGEMQQLLGFFNDKERSNSVGAMPVVEPGKSRLVPKAGSVQASIRLGKRCMTKRAEADYFDAVMVNHLLGGYFGSRLMKNIREEKGLTYGIYSAMHHFQHDSFWVIAAEVNQQNVQPALDEIRKEIQLLQEVPVSADELEVARNYFVGSWQSDNATLFAVADKVRNIHDFRLPNNYYDQLLSHVRSMTAVDVQRSAQAHFSAEELVEISVG